MCLIHSGSSLRLLVLGVVLICSGALQAQPILGIVAESTGCVSVLTSQTGGVYRGCGPDWRFRRLTGAPEALPVALAETRRSLLLATRTGLYQRTPSQVEWQRLSDQPAAALACGGEHCVVRAFGQGPRQLVDKQFSAPQAMGLPDQPLQQFVIAPSGAVYGAGMGAGVLRLEAGSDTWQSVGSGLSNRNVLAMVRADDGTLYAGTYGGGLYRLRVGENRWQRLSGLQASMVVALAVSADGRRVLASVGDGVQESRDGGDSWRQVPALAGASVLSLAFDHTDRAWAGTRAGQLYRQEGEEWKPEPVRFGTDLIVREMASGEHVGLVVLMGDRLYRRAHPDARWLQVETPFPISEAPAVLATDVLGRLYLGSARQPPQRLDSLTGQWQMSTSGWPERGGVRTLRTGPGNAVFAIHADTGQLHRLDLQQDRWTPVELGEQRANPRLSTLRRLPGEHGVAWGGNDLVWQRPGEPWRHNRFAQLERGAPGLDADGVLWTRRQVSVFSLQPGEDRWRDSALHHPLYVESVALTDGTELALTEDNRLMRLQRGEDGNWVEHSVHEPPGPPPYVLNTSHGKVYLGTVDGLYEMDVLDGIWRDITPTD